MFETLFSAETPLIARFFLPFLLLLGLIGATAGVVRWFGTKRLGDAGSHGRQPRLAVVDSASVDGRRRLILVRRDNVEHLLMIGGLTDEVVEPNIVPAPAAPNEVAAARLPAVAEPLPRAIPLPYGGSRSPQPKPAAAVLPAPRIEPLPEEVAARQRRSHAETSKRLQRDKLAALADELSSLSMPPDSRPPQILRVLETEPRMPTVHPAPAEPASADPNLAALAHHLKTSLRKPNSPPEMRAARSTEASAHSALQAGEHAPAVETASPPRTARMPEPKPARTDAKQRQSDLPYDSDNLKQQMAILLGGPISKT
jgi:flagellar protein FliO/FliZ